MDGPLVRLPLLPTGVDWTVCVRDAATGEVLAAQSPERVLRTASIGKIFLLCEAARRFESGEMDPGGPVSWLDEELVADSGLWHRLSLRSLPAVDACSLIGAVSDNLATNVFVRVLGIDSIRAMARALGCEDSALLDRVRDSRGPSDPPTLSVGRADELSSGMVQLHRCAAGAAGAVSPAVAARGRHVDMLINNAGYSIPQSFAAVSWQAQQYFLMTLVVNACGLAHGVIPGMARRGEGRIVNVEMGVLLGGGCPFRLVRIAVHAQERDALILAIGHGFVQFRARAHGPEDQLVALLDELLQNANGVGIIHADFRIHM